MNFSDCVLNLLFHVFTCDDHVDPLQLTFRSNLRSFVVSIVRIIHLWSLWVPVRFSLCATINYVFASSANFCL